MSVTKIIEQLAATGSTKEKEAILRSHADNDGLREVFRVAYSKELNFFVRSFKVDPATFHQGSRNLQESIDLIVNDVASRMYTGHEARDVLTNAVQLCEEPETLLKIINRDLECGIQTTLTNKVWKDLITEPPYQSYTLFKEDLLRNFNYEGAFSDEKMDGLYADIMVWPEQIIYRSRSGKELNFRCIPSLEQNLKEKANSDGPFVMHGEGLVIDLSYPHGVQPREIGNGYLNQDPENIDPNLVRLVVWDVVSMDEYIARKSKKKYKDRRKQVENIVNYVDESSHFQMIRGRQIGSLKEAIDHFIEMRLQKKEGTVLKEANMPWGDNKTKKGIKLKNEFDVDLEVVATTPHKKKPGLIGSLICRTRDGLLEVGAGSGLTDALRKKPSEYFIGQIITIKANDITNAENKDLKSLFLPRLNYKFVELRFDKSVANSLEEVIEASNSLLDLLRKIAEEV
ncbi:DNA ligase [Septuagintavirus sv54]|uniref:DNA ligase n=1 Tax=Escherichia phage A5-4 TaxID=2996162 RepID=A0AAE9TIT1_9CAUD|nr:DNA ligase [Escherichia phage A5-4]